MLQMFDSMYLTVPLDTIKAEPPQSPEKLKSKTAGDLARPVENNAYPERDSKPHAAPDPDNALVETRPLPTPCRAARPQNEDAWNDADELDESAPESNATKKPITRQDMVLVKSVLNLMLTYMLTDFLIRTFHMHCY